MNSVRHYIFPFFFLVNLFAGEIFGSYMSAKDISVKSGMLQNWFAVIGVISYIILMRDLFRGKNIKGNFHVIAILACILSMFIITGFFYPDVPDLYSSAILYFGCICIASSISGCHLATYPNFNKIDEILPFFILPIGLTISTFGYMSALKNGLVQTETSLDYQNVAYICAEMVAFGGYYIVFSTAKGLKSFNLFKIPVLITCFVCAIVCLISGGRGGAVLLLFYLLFFLYKLRNLRGIGILKSFIIIGIIIAIFFIIANNLNLWKSDGFSRVLSSINVDDARAGLRRKSLQIFYDTDYVGGGLGSIWMNLGIYSHNIFLDLLAEIGILGCIVVSLSIYKIVKKLLRLSKENIGCMLILLIFFKGFILCLFSGYWLNTYQLWFAVGFVFALPSINSLRNAR
ncbi:hypothetical protein AB9N12_16695 [Bacteroides sp. AN502(2024)]|uniref:hypothetical protein n=1 Tax=Bacteroides sp. AN502(2024) TaxID=3160599 RepID=UPI0035184681